jgi:glutamate-1-semialdehyde aminotransferase
MKFDLWHRQQNTIAQGALTNSKHPSMHVYGVYPTHCDALRNYDCYLIGEDGKKYIDFICGLGTNMLGYGNDLIARHVAPYLRHAQSPSLPTVLEIQAVEELRTMLPMAERVKWLKSGTAACSAAIKIARAHQGVRDGKENVLEMFAQEVINQFLSRCDDERRSKLAMQEMPNGVSEHSERSGTLQKRDSNISENEKRPKIHKKLSKEIHEDLAENETCKKSEKALLPSNQSGQSWFDKENVLQSMWQQKSSSSSRGLHETIVREMVMRASSRRGTPKFLILSDGYHGHDDQFTSLTGPHSGCLKDLAILPLKNNEDMIEYAAGVIIEPVITDWSDDRRKDLYKLHETCKKHGCLLIFDEIISAFRFREYFVCRWLNIEPDMVLVGKCIANGFALSGVVGKKEIMDSDYFVSTTFAGETCALAAAIKTMNMMRTNPDFDLKKLWENGADFIEQFNAIWPEGLTIEGYPTRGVFKGSPTQKALFFQEMAISGVLFCSTWFYNHHLCAHKKEVINLAKHILDKIRHGSVKLKGDLPQSPFAAKVRGG